MSLQDGQEQHRSLTGGGGGGGGSFVASVLGEGSGVGSFIAGTKIPDQGPLSLTARGATMSLITLVIGAGVISLPNSIGQAGVVVGFSIVIFTGIVAVDSGRILCVAASLSEEAGHSIQCFEDIGLAACGAIGKNVSLLMMQVMYFLIAAIFILLTGQYLGLIIDTAAGKNETLCCGVFPLLMSLNGGTFGGWMLVACIILIPTLFMWDMSTVAKFAPAGIAGALVLIFCMFVGSCVVMVQYGLAPSLAPNDSTGNEIVTVPPSYEEVVSIFLKAIFAYSGVASVPTMRPEMIEPDKLAGCVIQAMSFVTFVYVVVSIPAIMAFGVPSSQLLAFVEKAFLYIGSVGIVVHVFIALPIILNVFYNTTALTILPILKTRNPASLLIRLIVLICAFIVPLVFGKLGPLIDLVSAVTMISTMIFLPITFYWVLLARKEGSFGKAISTIGWLPFLWQIVMMIIGACASVTGIMQGVKELQDPAHCPLPLGVNLCGNTATAYSGVGAEFIL